MLQRPLDLDTAMVLAQLQEEAGVMMKRNGSKWGDSTTTFKPRQGAAPVQPVKEPKHMTASSTCDKSSGGPLPSTDECIASLYAYHKAKGLCYKCGLQYNHGHRCSDTVQLQVVEELWQMVQCTNTKAVAECAEVPEDNVEINALQLSKAAVDGSEAPRTMKFVGHIAGMDILALLDSGSSHSFLSMVVASSIPAVSTMD
jgi:hypothetical protein